MVQELVTMVVTALLVCDYFRDECLLLSSLKRKELDTLKKEDVATWHPRLDAMGHRSLRPDFFFYFWNVLRVPGVSVDPSSGGHTKSKATQDHSEC